MASGVKGFGRQIGHTDKTCSPVSQVRLRSLLSLLGHTVWLCGLQGGGQLQGHREP